MVQCQIDDSNLDHSSSWRPQIRMYPLHRVLAALSVPNRAESSSTAAPGVSTLPATVAMSPDQLSITVAPQCQRSHWRTHKTECKVFQTRRCIHRAALVLGSFVGIVEAKGDMAMARLAVFMTELFKGKGHETESPLSSNQVFSSCTDIPVIVQEAVVNVINEPAETSPRESHAYKITTNTDDSD